jgi:predicted nucleic acid-binding protein
MSRNILVDTDIVIDFLRGNKQALSYFKSETKSICFSAITVAEIYAGIKGKKEEAEVERLFSIFPVISATHEIAREAGKFVSAYRPSHSVEIPDAIIAATCLLSGAELSTCNVKHYPMFKGLKPPYKKHSHANAEFNEAADTALDEITESIRDNKSNSGLKQDTGGGYDRYD